MVQRKAEACNKPSLNNLESSSSSSSLHRNHGKNTLRPDLKNTMKRSSIERQEQSAAIEGDHSTLRKQSNDMLMMTNTPNYMKSTSSSTAKKLEEQSASSLRASAKNVPRFKSTVKKKRRCSEVVVLSEDMKMEGVAQKPTCSSTLRHRKFPNYLELRRHDGGTESSYGTSVFKVCPYTYCSLNGHYREPRLPPLKMFLSAKRSALKASLKKEEKITNKDGEEALGQNEDDEASSDMELIATSMASDICDYKFEYECSSQTNIVESESKGIIEHQTNIVESESKGMIEHGDGDVSQDTPYADTIAFPCSSDTSEAIYDPESLNAARVYESVEPKLEEDPNRSLDLSEDARNDIIHVGHLNSSDKEGKERNPKTKIQPRENQMRDFNPRGPNFLPLEPDPDEEKVDLKHQELDGRRNSEEFMLDYALRQAVTKLAPTRKRKVALIVEALEKVMPEIHSKHCTRFGDQARVVQACN